MKKFCVAILGISLAMAAPASAAAQPAPAPVPVAKATPLDPASLAVAQQIITIAFPPEKRSQMYASMMNSIISQARTDVEAKTSTGDKGLDAIVDRSMLRMYDQLQASLQESLPDIFDSFARAYARGFSRDDLQAILAFVKTPAGQRYFQRLPQLLADPDIQAANKRMSEKLLVKLPGLEAQTKQEVEAYVEKKLKEKKAAAVPVS